MSSPPTLPPTDLRNLPGAPAIRHLHWCLPTFCETVEHSAGRETLHRGAPIVWKMTGDDADVIMRRAQYDDGEPFCEIHFAHRSYPEEITLSFSDDDVSRLLTGVHELRECR